MTQLFIGITLALVGAIVLALVVYLVGIIWALRGAAQNLEALAAGLISVRDSTKPLPDHLTHLNGGLSELLKGMLDVNGNLADIVQLTKKS